MSKGKKAGNNDQPVKPFDENAKAAEVDAILARVGKKFPRTGHLMRAFLVEYEKTESQTLSGNAVGVGHDSVAAWKKDEEFMRLFTLTHIRAQRKNNDNLRSSMIQRGINGTPHPLIKAGAIVRDEAGNPVIAYREFETQLTLFLAKNRLPDEFRDKFEHEIAGQLIQILASEFIGIVRRHVTPTVATSIQKELETLPAKIGKS